MTRTVQITDIAFDCSLEDSDWTEKDQLETEENLPKAYIGMVVELDLDDNAEDEDVVYELCEEVSTSSGWLINSIDYREV